MIEKLLTVLLRATAAGLGVFGLLLLLLAGYVSLTLMPELVLVTVLGTSLSVASLWLWKKSGRIV